jgi:TrmH family RNA methyltransferase
MITKAQVKHISSLVDKKSRIEFNEFVVEGEKSVDELIRSNFHIKEIYAIKQWIDMNQQILSANATIIEVSYNELERISFQKQPHSVLAVVALPHIDTSVNVTKALLLDTLQDPGNMGSIIRIADWFGVNLILCHGACVDAFSPKVVQATMGSIFRVQIQTVHAVDFLKSNNDLPSYVAVLDGEDVSKVGKIEKGIIVIGNESKGVCEEIIQLCTQKIMIPRIGEAESLNAAIATGILCYALL